MGNSMRSIENLMENSILFLNEQINKVDWNKKWQADYPRTERARYEFETLRKPEVKEVVSEVFNEKSLAVMKLEEAFV